MADSPDKPTDRLTEQKFLLSLLLAGGVIGMFSALMRWEIPKDNRDVVIALVTAWTTLGFASMVKFNFDGTKAGDAKNEVIATQAKQVGTLMDYAAANPPAAPPPAPGTANVQAAADVSVDVHALDPKPEAPRRTEDVRSEFISRYGGSDPAPAGDVGPRLGEGRPAE